MVPEIWSATDIIFCHTGPFFALLPPPPVGPRKSKLSKKWKKHLKILSFYKHKQQSYDVWFLRYGVQQTEFENLKILKKMEKFSEDIITLHRCNINDNHMMYGY